MNLNLFPYYDYDLGLLDRFLEKSLVICNVNDDFERIEEYEFEGFESASEGISSDNSETFETESGTDQVESSVSGNSSQDGVETDNAEGRLEDLSQQLQGYNLNESQSVYIQSSEGLTIDYSNYFENLQNIGIVLIVAVLAGFASLAFMKGFKK